MFTRNLLLCLLVALSVLASTGRTLCATPAPPSLDGRWIGGFVRDGAILNCEVDIRWTEDGYVAQFWIPEWVYYDNLTPVAMESVAEGVYRLETVRGPVQLHLDESYMEFFGRVVSAEPDEDDESESGLSSMDEPLTTLHLKRDVRPISSTRLVEESVSFATDVELSGTMIVPEHSVLGREAGVPGLLMIHGRGCWGGGGNVRTARAFARRGVAGLAYDKRGTGESGGSCDTATLDELVRDAEAALDLLMSDPRIDPDRVFIMGGSAGAWVCARLAATRPELAGVITYVGPAMSVEAQQRENCRLTVLGLGLSPEVEARALTASSRYLDLMFRDLLPAQEQFAEMMALKAEAEAVGWDWFFEETDIPTGPEALDQLWVRRFAYDPAADLRVATQPWLAMFGQLDDVVPPSANIELFESLLTHAPFTEMRVIPVLGHGAEHGDRQRELTNPTGAGEVSYFKFDRVDYRLIEWPLEFMDRVFASPPAAAP